jgi:hypothetical protein
LVVTFSVSVSAVPATAALVMAVGARTIDPLCPGATDPLFGPWMVNAVPPASDAL